MMRLLAALLMATLISTGLVSLIAVLVLPQGTSPDSQVPRPAQPVAVSQHAVSVSPPPATTGGTDASLLPPVMPAAPALATPSIPQLPPQPAVPTTVAAGTGPVEPPALPPLYPAASHFSLPQVALPATRGEPGSAASSLQPLYRVEPHYPPGAQRVNLEGFVRLGFTITAKGRVSDIKVLDAKSAGIFEQAAIQVLWRWRYPPQPQQGEAPRQQTVNLFFELSGRHP